MEIREGASVEAPFLVLGLLGYALVTMGEIGLFPLGLVLVPGERVPLHIFEDRYKELIGECLETGAEFGLVLADDDGLRSVGTRASVLLVLERFDDGRLNIVVEGGERFRILAITEGRTFATAEVEPLADMGEADQPSEGERSECVAAYRRLMAAARSEPEDLDLTTGNLGFQLAGRVEFGSTLKQELLEMRSERERVIRVTELLDGAIKLIELRRVARERAGGNGHVQEL